MSLPLFWCSSSNFAWGNYSAGYIVDDGGRIWTYNTTDFGPSASRFQNLVLQSLRVGRDDLAAKQRLLAQASKGRIVKEQRGADMGEDGCGGYLRPPGEPVMPVQLGAVGDWAVQNTAPEAAILLHWLRVDLGMGAPQPQPPAPLRKPRPPSSSSLRK